MAIRRYRTILEQSNPRVIREFQIDDGRSFQELLKMIVLIHGWKQSDEVAEQVMAVPEHRRLFDYKIRDLFDNQKQQNRIHVPCTGPYADAEDLIIRLEELGIVEEGEALEPILLWTQGLNPVSRISSIQVWNKCHNEVLRQGYCSEYRMSAVHLEKQIPRIEDINQTLHLQIVEGRSEIRFDRSKGETLKKILDGHTVADLKDMIQMTGLGIPYNMRKAMLVDRLAEYFDQPASWEKILREMKLQEYKALLEICYGRQAVSEVSLPTLARYCLLTAERVYWEDEMIPIEFMDYLLQLAYRGEDRLICKRKQIGLVLEACRILYGVFSKDQAYRVTQIMFGQEYDAEAFGQYWSGQGYFELLGEDVMYCRRNMQEHQAQKIYQEAEARNIPYYTPDREELFQIAQSGLSFSVKAFREIAAAVRKFQGRQYWYYADPESITQEIYDYYRLGWNRSSIESQLRSRYHIGGNSKACKELFDLIERYRGEVRRIHLRGNTELIQPSL